MYRKNVAGQFCCFQLLLTASGAIATGLSPTVRRCIDGTFAAGGGTVTEDTGTGAYKYAMTQADTNGNDISLMFTATGAMPVCINFITTACDPTAATNFGITGIPAVASGSAGALIISGTGTAALSVSSGLVTLAASQPGVTIPTVTTVTNQLTAAAIATGIWQDTTAGDFTTASSIGKSLYTTGNAPGAASGIALVGSNMGTITGALTAAQIATGVWTDTTAGDFTTALSVGKSVMNGVALGTGLTVNDITTKTGYSLSGTQTFNVTGNITGNLSGSVGSVTGAVGSVTGAVGSVTGAVGSVTGAVGSVASGGISRASLNADTGLQSIRSNTATAGGATSITLDGSASAVDSFYNNCLCYLTGGTGAGQSRFITGYVGSTKIATVSSAWATNPDATTTFAIEAFDAIPGATAPTAAQVATAVWTDATAGDFTTALSVGKSLMNGVALGTGLTVNDITTKTGYSLSASQTFNITGNLSGSVGSVTGAVGSVTGRVTANTDQFNGAALGAANIAFTTAAIGRATVSGSPTSTSIPTSACTPNGAVADQFKGRIITFDAATTTAALRGQATDITASSNAAAPTFTVTALTTAPVSGDTFSIT